MVDIKNKIRIFVVETCFFSYRFLIQAFIYSTVWLFLLYCYILVLYDMNTIFFQFLIFYPTPVYIFNINLFFGLDGFNIWFLLLTSIILLLSYMWVQWVNLFSSRFFLVSILFLLYVVTICTFLTLDFFIFFCLFEVLLLPMFFLFTFYTSRNRSKKAVMYFLLYTVLGSILLLIGLLIILSNVGTLNVIYLKEYWFDFDKQVVLLLLLIPGFATKIPIYPLHLWLPEAHVEAPTIGSVILAALLLKLGCYGILRFAISFLPFSLIYFGPFLFFFAVFSATASSISALRQVDLKKLIAYASINHMGLVLAGLTSSNIYSIEGSLHLMLSHGIISSGLFFCIGSLYERFHTKLLLYYSGLASLVPYNIFFFFFVYSG